MTEPTYIVSNRAVTKLTIDEVGENNDEILLNRYRVGSLVPSETATSELGILIKLNYQRSYYLPAANNPFSGEISINTAFRDQDQLLVTGQEAQKNGETREFLITIPVDQLLQGAQQYSDVADIRVSWSSGDTLRDVAKNSGVTPQQLFESLHQYTHWSTSLNTDFFLNPRYDKRYDDPDYYQDFVFLYHYRNIHLPLFNNPNKVVKLPAGKVSYGQVLTEKASLEVSHFWSADTQIPVSHIWPRLKFYPDAGIVLLGSGDNPIVLHGEYDEDDKSFSLSDESEKQVLEKFAFARIPISVPSTKYIVELVDQNGDWRQRSLVDDPTRQDKLVLINYQYGLMISPVFETTELNSFFGIKIPHAHFTLVPNLSGYELKYLTPEGWDYFQKNGEFDGDSTWFRQEERSEVDAWLKTMNAVIRDKKLND